MRGLFYHVSFIRTCNMSSPCNDAWTMDDGERGMRNTSQAVHRFCVCVCVWSTGFHRHDRVLDVWTQSLQAEQVARWVGRSVFTQSNLGRLFVWLKCLRVSLRSTGQVQEFICKYWLCPHAHHMHTLLYTQLHFLPSCRLLIPPD